MKKCKKAIIILIILSLGVNVFPVLGMQMEERLTFVKSVNSPKVLIDSCYYSDPTRDDIIESIDFTPSNPKVNEKVTFTSYLKIPQNEVKICLWAFDDEKLFIGVTANRKFYEKGEYGGVFFVYTNDNRYDYENFTVQASKGNVAKLFYQMYEKLLIWRLVSYKGLKVSRFEIFKTSF